jgi:hypothetical protein
MEGLLGDVNNRINLIHQYVIRKGEIKGEILTSLRADIERSPSVYERSGSYNLKNHPSSAHSTLNTK